MKKVYKTLFQYDESRSNIHGGDSNKNAVIFCDSLDNPNVTWLKDIISDSGYGYIINGINNKSKNQWKNFLRGNEKIFFVGEIGISGLSIEDDNMKNISEESLEDFMTYCDDNEINYFSVSFITDREDIESFLQEV